MGLSHPREMQSCSFLQGLSVIPESIQLIPA